MESLQKVNFSEPINYLKNSYSKFVVTSFYGPVFSNFIDFSEATTEVAEKISATGNFTVELFNMALEALSIFHYKNIREHFEELISILSSSILDIDGQNYFSENCQKYLQLYKNHSPDENQVQLFRNKSMNFFRIFYSDLSEMEKSYRYLEGIVKQTHDSTSAVRTGMTGGMLGATVGSFLLPGIGTAAGAVIGGFLMGKNKEKKLLEGSLDHFDNYINHSRAMICKMTNNAKELYLINSKFMESYYINNIKNFYLDLKKIESDADSLMIEMFKYDIDTIDRMFDNKVNDEDEASITYRDFSESVYEFIRSYREQ